MFEMDLEKAKQPEIKLPTFIGSSKKQDQKNIYFCFIDYAKAFDCVDHNKLWKIQVVCGRPPDLTHEKPVCRSRSNSLYWIWNNGLVPNWERRTSRLYIVTLLI